MGQRRIYELDFPDFSNMLRAASSNHKTIEKTDKEAWVSYVRKHDVPEAAMFSRGKAGTMSNKVNFVIIDGAGKSDGYYVYSADEAFCLKFESGLE